MKDQSGAKRKLTPSIMMKIMKDTVQGFMDDNVLQLSASLAYATLFSIIPFLSLIVTIGTFFHTDLTNQLFVQLQPILGAESVEQLKTIILNAKKTDSSTLTAIVSLGVTIFGATAIFAEIQGSLNSIWGIKAIPKKSWLKYIKNRLLSFSIILIFAFILLITFTITNVIGNLSDRFMSNYPDIAESFVKLVGLILNIGVTSFIFVLMYKILPDAKIKSKDVLVGALVTTILFLIGQWGISLYIGMASVGTVYGAAAFMVILITWIYYSAIIIYIGAEFTEAWANEMGSKIFPDEFAVTTRIIEIHGDKPAESVNKIEINEQE
ncbi:YihY/virulence factor BrkB family protein [Bacteroides sp. 51]|uniref:YihY/virulence factor BrkB family protein n=1 Tax=Bacteroides sp. 51 TaxID=2302938 RepID=UPI0013D1562F|nr:YihY/virulence factor BrkB family protein [Bacteroides sp. 51]NDV81978.1 YihY/virulence factor BrkB family protein [Bacteroides sp. 51]